MKARMVVFALAPLLTVMTAGSTAPPPAPNFCTRGLCLEIAGFSAPHIEVTTNSNNVRSEIAIRSPAGLTKVFYSLAIEERCDLVHDIQLRKIGLKYVGESCLAFPDSTSKGIKLSIEFAPTRDIPTSPNSMDLPILHLWTIDAAPVSFWKSGYALRLGEGKNIRWPSAAE